MLHFKKVVVTGGYGFIGSALIRKLLKNTNVEIFNIDKMSPVSNSQSIDNLLSLNPSYKKRYYFFKTNIENYEEVNKVFTNISPDICSIFNKSCGIIEKLYSIFIFEHSLVSSL